MSDDSGTRRPGPRRRATRRLPRHAARVLADAAVLPADGAIGPADVASSDSSRSEDALEDVAEDRVSAPAQPDAPRSIEHSPLLAALSAVADGGLQAANTDAEQASAVAADSGSAKPSNDAAVNGSRATESVDAPVTDGRDGTEEELPFVTEAELPMARGLEPASPLQDESVAAGKSAKSDRSDAHAAAGGEADGEVQTRPKIRLPDGAARRISPRPVSPVSHGAAALDPESADGPAARPAIPPRRMSSAPPGSLRRGVSPLPPPPDPVGRVSRLPAVPTGEGIIRASQPGPRPSLGSGYGRPDIDSDVPTRPRIPLTHDMALAAGRLTSLDLPRVSQPAEGGEDTHPRISFASGLDAAGAGPAPTVVVTRARMITGAPPAADAGEPERRRSRPSRRARPDSEEFETLDLEDGEEEPSGRDASESAVDGRGSEAGLRARTPPPPPGQGQSKRGGMSPAMQRPAPPPPPPPGAAKKQVPTQKARSKRRAWWEVLFSDDYVRTLPRPEPALVAQQVDFMEASLGLSRGDAVLDVGCGLGQHALEFARRGYLVVALDLALSMITRAAEEAQQHNLRINFLHKDIRDIGFEGTFDAVVCFGTTFGFFDDEQNRGVLQRLAHALKPGGRLLLDVVNRDYVLPSQPNLVWFEGDGCVVMEESDFNFYTSRLTVKRTMMREDGRQSESEYSVRLYSVHELGQLLKQAGFGIKEVSGQEATRGLFFGSNSSRIIMLAERRSSGRSQSLPPESDG